METKKIWIAGKLIASVGLLGAIVACSGSDDDTPAANSPSAEAPEEEESASGDLAIPALSLTMTAPRGAEVSEMLGQQMIQGTGLVVSVKPATESDPATLETARSESEMFNPTNVADETLADGWVLTYQNQGGLGANYFVTARREIGGTAYMCTTMVGSAEQQRAAVDACKSLRRS